MQLKPGAKIGPYEILSALGEGGMGQVWKARDTRLDRVVTIKTSSAKFSERFEREARAVAALNHPHICTLYDVGPDYLVMEYVEGPEIKGPLPLDQALRLAIQLASALEAAHRKGITHRDLKPANILNTKSGVKVLDFGLATLASPDKTESDETVTKGLTQEGAIVGTLQFMAPEQLQGKKTDGRADIFSFGCVLYQMLTGKRAFDGANTVSVIAAIMERPAPSVGEIAPESINWLLGRCLAKDPDERWQSARDLRASLERCSEGMTYAVRPAVRGRPAISWIAAGLFAVLLAGLGFVHFRETPASNIQLAQFVVEPPVGTDFINPVNNDAISPDGRFLVFGAGKDANSALWLRPIDSLSARMLEGTENSNSPFWSPDSKSIGFFAGRKLKRTDIAGGAPQVLCDASVMTTSIGGTWNRDGTILFAQGTGLLRVPASGGAPQSVTQPDSQRNETAHSMPQFLPDGNRFFYFISSGDPDVMGVYAGSLDHPGNRLRILAADHKVTYVPPVDGHSGFLLWLRERSLLSQPFDQGRLRLEGEATPVADNVVTDGYANAAFFASDTGLLVYRSGSRRQTRKLVWMSRDGKIQGDSGNEENYQQFRLSPDGTRLAVTISDDNGNADIWVIDLSRGIKTRLTFTPKPRFNPAWSPDARQLAYDSNQTGIRQLYRVDAGGAGQEEQLSSGPNNKGLSDWSRDGRLLLYQDLDPRSGFDLGVLPLEGERKPLVMKTPFSKVLAKFSPDGNWIAYVSNESGRNEVYLRVFPVSGGQWQVSSQGGTLPRWRADGKELYYMEPATNSIMAAAIQIVGKSIQTDAPRKLFAIPSIPGGGAYEVTADGQRFIAFQPVASAEGPVPLTVVVNWQAGLKK